MNLSLTSLLGRQRQWKDIKPLYINKEEEDEE